MPFGTPVASVSAVLTPTSSPRSLAPTDIYQEALKIIVEAWWGDSDSFLSGILHGVTRFVAMYRDEYSRERLIARLSTVHPKTITKNARKDTGNTADRHMKQILEIYNGSSRSLSLPVKR